MCDTIALYHGYIKMKWTTLIAVNDTIRTGLQVASVASTIIKSRGKLSPYIADWSYLLDSAGGIVVRLNIAILNRSQSDEIVSQVLLAARADKAISFAPTKVRTSWQGNARIRLDDRRLYDICSNDEVLALPSTITGGAVVSGWFAFVIDSSQVELVKQHKWGVVVVDQDGRQYRSRATQDQSID
jgi:hypothetical protein